MINDLERRLLVSVPVDRGQRQRNKAVDP